jgi:hypothetical protein
MDLDLDGDIDNKYVSKAYMNGVYSCETSGIQDTGVFGMPDSADPLASWIGARDWLDQVYHIGGVCGSATSASHTIGRSSQFDWMRYWWDMASDESVPMSDLADIYVDMCPTDWVAAPSTPIVDMNWPEKRLERSTAFHGYGSEHTTQRDNGVDHF